MGINLKAGDKIPLFLLLENRATDRVVRATIRNEFGTEISGSPATVPHLANGEYFSDAIEMPNTSHIMVTYDVFDGPGFTNLSQDLLPAEERFDLDDLGSAIDELRVAARQSDLDAEVTDNESLSAEVTDPDQLGVELTDQEELKATVTDTEQLTGQVDSDTDIEGGIDC